MLLAWGGQDFCFGDPFLKEWKRRFPNARVRYYAKAGHYVLEDVGETLIPEIRAFLEESPVVDTREQAAPDKQTRSGVAR
jgi:haloalkane dehalogenase